MKSQERSENPSSGKVGSDSSAAEHFADRRDFGIPTNKANPSGRGVDAGEGMPRNTSGRAGATGDRTAGVGGNASGPGSSSGGDIDTDVIGIGDEIGLAGSGPDEDLSGPSIVTGGSSPEAISHHPRHGASPLVRGDTMDHSGDDASTVGAGAGAAAASGTEGPDDAAAGEISSDEASGADN